MLGNGGKHMSAFAETGPALARATTPPRLIARRRERSWLASSPAWSFAFFLVVAIAFLLARGENRYFGTVAGALIFFLVQCFFPGCRPVSGKWLCPWNRAHFVFFLQLVLLPLSVLAFGPRPGVLPSLPSGFAINVAMLLNCAAFLAFCAVYHFLWRRSNTARRAFAPAAENHGGPSFSLVYIALNAAIGFAGVFFAFGNWHALHQYFSDPSGYLDGLRTATDKFGTAAGLFLRPFLGFALVMLWCRWLDRRNERERAKSSGMVTLAAILAVCLANATFHYNRGSLLVPLIAMLAVILSGPRRLSRRTFAFACAALVLLLAFMPFYGVYRSSDFTLRQVATKRSACEFLSDKIDLPEMFQVYGGAPQFLAYFLEADRWAARPRWGRVLVSSVLSPVPILGKPFRPSAGSAIYNRLIYGTPDIADQVAPFVGELFLDFHLAGVLAGFCLLGWLARKLELAFENSRRSIDIFLWQYISIWTFFLIFGSVSVLSQVLLYFGWPIYFYLFSRRFRIHSPRVAAPGPAAAAVLGAAGGMHP